MIYLWYSMVKPAKMTSTTLTWYSRLDESNWLLQAVPAGCDITL